MVCMCFQNESYSWGLSEVLQVHVSCDGVLNVLAPLNSMRHLVIPQQEGFHV